MPRRKLPPEVVAYFRAEGAKGGRKSAAARLEKLSPEQRSEIGRNAAKARWAKAKAAKAK